MARKVVFTLDAVKEGQSSFDTFESYQDAHEQLDAAKQHALEAARAAFSAGCRELFTGNPELRSFEWQYDVFGPELRRPKVNGRWPDDEEDPEPELTLRLSDEVGEWLCTFEDHIDCLPDADVSVKREDYHHVAGDWCELSRAYVEACGEVAKAEKAVRTAAKIAFVAECRSLFAENPDLASFEFYIPLLPKDGDVTAEFLEFHEVEKINGETCFNSRNKLYGPVSKSLCLFRAYDIAELFGQNVYATVLRDSSAIEKVLNEEPIQLQTIDRTTLETEAAACIHCKTIERSCIRYIQHHASSYSDLVRKLPRAWVDERFESKERRDLVDAIKKRFLDSVAEQYPYLQEECTRLKARDGLVENSGDFVMPYGPAKGRKLSSLDTSFLRGLSKRRDIKHKHKKRIEFHLAERELQAS